MVPVLSQMCLFLDSTVEQALKTLNLNAQGICFVVDKDNVFVGVITDGDIRRCLLNGCGLASNIQDIVNRGAVTLAFDSSAELIQKSFTSKIKHIPLLDKDGRVVDYACLHRLHRIPVMEPFLGGNELAYVTDCIKTGWISSKGSYVTRFEEAVAKLCGSPHAVAVSNGTVALHLALEALNIGVGDEVIVPDFTFAATINAVLYTGATPIIVDIEPETWTISSTEIQKAITPKTKAIIPVHIYGHPCDMPTIMAIAKAHDLLVIEDCAESLGSTLNGQMTGTFGDAATFSFFGNKVITTGEGGMVLFKDQTFLEKAKVLRDHGMNPNKRYWHDTLGYNYRMTNLQAAIGLAQMEQIQGFLEKRKCLAQNYNKAFAGTKGVYPQPLKPNATSCHWLYTILLSEELKIERDVLIEKLLMNGIETRPTFYPLHEMPIYKSYAGNRQFSHSNRISRRGISLPSSVNIDSNEVHSIALKIKDLIEVADINGTYREAKI